MAHKDKSNAPPARARFPRMKQKKQICSGGEIGPWRPLATLPPMFTPETSVPHVLDAIAMETAAPAPPATVVLLHSSLASKSQWTALAGRLSLRSRVVAPDLHGYGDNPMPPPSMAFGLDDEVRLVERHLGRLAGSSRVHLVGHSYGALVALRFAQVHGARVDGLTLYEPVAFRLLAGDDEALRDVKHVAARVAHLVGAGRNQDAAQAFVDFWNGDGYFEALPMPARSAVARRVAKVPLDFGAAMRWQPRDADLRAIGVPVLLLRGRDSPAATRRICAALASALPNCELQECEAGHMGPLTHPDCVNPRVESFIARCASAQHTKQDSAPGDIALMQAAPTVHVSQPTMMETQHA